MCNLNARRAAKRCGNLDWIGRIAVLLYTSIYLNASSIVDDYGVGWPIEPRVLVTMRPEPYNSRGETVVDAADYDPGHATAINRP